MRSPAYYLLVSAAYVGAMLALIVGTTKTTQPSPSCRTLSELRAESRGYPRWTIVDGRKCWYVGSKAEARRKALRRSEPVDIPSSSPVSETRPATALRVAPPWVDDPPAPPPEPEPVPVPTPDPRKETGQSVSFPYRPLNLPVHILATRLDAKEEEKRFAVPPPEPRTMWPIFLLATFTGAILIIVIHNMIIPPPVRRKPAKRAKPELWPPSDLGFELPAWCYKQADIYNGRIK